MSMPARIQLSQISFLIYELNFGSFKGGLYRLKKSNLGLSSIVNINKRAWIRVG